MYNKCKVRVYIKMMYDCIKTLVIPTIALKMKRHNVCAEAAVKLNESRERHTTSIHNILLSDEVFRGQNDNYRTSSQGFVELGVQHRLRYSV
jgi:hypothetical protein